MSIILVDSFSETNADAYNGMYGGWYIKRAQSFTAKAGNLSSCKFYLKKAGSPTGNAVAILYAHSGTYGASSVPTGAALATSNNFGVSTLTTSNQLIEFTFTGAQQYAMINGTYYCITCEYSGGDSSNLIYVASDVSSPTHGGNAAEYLSSWAALSGHDNCFYVYATIADGSFLLNFI